MGLNLVGVGKPNAETYLEDAEYYVGYLHRVGLWTGFSSGDVNLV